MAKAATAKATKLPAQKTKRILTFDLMRGYFLVVIFLNHLGWYASGFEFLTFKGRLFVSTAEGFFLLSGLVLGIVRGQKLKNEPFKVPAKLLLRRAFQLYVTSIILMLIFTIIGWLFFMDNPGLKPGIRPLTQPLGEVLFGAITYKYIYGWADFLRLYAIYIFIAPVALWLLRKGWWYIVLLLSALVWWLFDINTMGGSNELLMVLPWQFIFFSGFTIGYNWSHLVAYWQSLKLKTRKTINLVINTVAVLTIAVNILLVSLAPHYTWAKQSLSVLGPYFDKLSLPLPRVLLFAAWFWFGFWLFNRYEKQINKYLGWLLLPFGQNSLYVYIMHAFLVFFAHLIMPKPSPYWWVNLAGTLGLLALLYISVKTKFLMRIIPR